MSKEYLSDYTSTISEEEWREHAHVYCYTVYWKERFNFTDNTWYHKPFANKKNAKAFAKKKKSKEIKLKPYIIQKVVYGSYFRKDVTVEYAQGETFDFAEVIRV